jgi:hypothetical protein
MDAVEAQILQLRGEMRDEFSAIRERFERIDQRFEGMDRQFQTIDGRFEETHRFMRVLHEEVLTRISLLQEGGGRRKR